MRQMPRHAIQEALTRETPLPQLRQDIQVREFYYFDAIILAPERIEQAWTWQRYGRGWTMLVNDLPVAACGYVEFPPGVANFWGLCAKMREQTFHVKRRFHMEVRWKLNAFNFHRLQMFVDKNDQTAIKWAKRLGFVLDDIQLWSRVKHG